MSIQNSEYPELNEIAEKVTDIICFMINRFTQGVESAMPYRAQYVLEETIKLLKKRV